MRLVVPGWSRLCWEWLLGLGLRLRLVNRTLREHLESSAVLTIVGELGVQRVLQVYGCYNPALGTMACADGLSVEGDVQDGGKNVL